MRYALRMRLASLRTILTPLAALAAFASASFAQDKQPTTAQAGEMDGYLGVPQERVALDFSGGFAMHVAAWPLLGVLRDTRSCAATLTFVLGGAEVCRCPRSLRGAWDSVCRVQHARAGSLTRQGA
jgi:hypothetical protein